MLIFSAFFHFQGLVAYKKTECISTCVLIIFFRPRGAQRSTEPAWVRRGDLVHHVRHDGGNFHSLSAGHGSYLNICVRYLPVLPQGTNQSFFFFFALHMTKKISKGLRNTFFACLVGFSP